MSVRAARFARATSQCKGDTLSVLSYTLIFPSAPSGTLTMLRLASPIAGGGFRNEFLFSLGRVTGGVCALKWPIQ